ncbi:MAG: nucleotidyltransferase family protein [Chitinophagales bacterium]|nr:nucleotidyltransferase family protein [Chitinophagales bacterium]
MALSTTTALVLAGGFGTRLQSVVKDVPKPMAEISGKPFLYYLFLYLKKCGIKKVVLLVGFKHEIIESYFKNNYEGIEVEYSIEHEPLGTGGAILQAMKQLNENCFLLNGDTFFDVDLSAMESSFEAAKTDVALALSLQQNFDRYGTVRFNEENLISEFQEKKFVQEGWINGGVYWINKNLFSKIEATLNTKLPTKFSLEKEVFEAFTTSLHLKAFKQEKYFIDIGIPDDYARAQNELPQLFSQP